MVIEKKAYTKESFPFISAAEKPDFKAAGYVEEEYFMRGTANIYEETGENSKKVRYPDVPYCNRFLVRKPEHAEDFSGDVMIEILNATAGFDIDRMWILGKDEIMRRGAVYVGITSKPDVFASLKKFHADCYGEISWKAPFERKENEDEKNTDPKVVPREKDQETGLFWDMLTDLTKYLRTDTQILPAGKDRKMYLLGWSQSVGYMTTYRNYFAFSEDGENIFDGYLAAGGVHMLVIPLNQDGYGKALPHKEKVDIMPVPFIAAQTESENAHFGAYEARQENSDTPELKYRCYEIAGCTHDTVYSLLDYYKEDAYLYEIGVGPQYVGDNEHPNDYPSQYAIAALFSHLLDWVRKGIVPPEAPRIEVDEALENVRDENGNAVGGVRLPQIDVPAATYYNYSDSSVIPDGRNPLFGHVEYFSKEKLTELYGTLAAYEAKVRESAEQAVRHGYLLEADKESCVQNAVQTAARIGLE